MESKHHPVHLTNLSYVQTKSAFQCTRPQGQHGSINIANPNPETDPLQLRQLKMQVDDEVDSIGARLERKRIYWSHCIIKERTARARLDLLDTELSKRP
jgi:hypothetical protein